ncbi:hypothetical protein [Candidatus Chloroploca asiatica]|uniref:hypothetical protein n=1 Tax=Candidatus Chloroploca asiatica TaxID=1506545 RepID=UPI0015589CF8|nr:hypothetical protein [Candidatus Chloroploca asiatica]
MSPRQGAAAMAGAGVQRAGHGLLRPYVRGRGIGHGAGMGVVAAIIGDSVTSP